MTLIAVILGSTRPGRRGERVAHWVMEQAGTPADADFELVDLADYPLPHLDEVLPSSTGRYQKAHTQQWAATIGRFDGFVFVTPEYNHSTSGVLKNAIDFLRAAWNRDPNLRDQRRPALVSAPLTHAGVGLLVCLDLRQNPMWVQVGLACG